MRSLTASVLALALLGAAPGCQSFREDPLGETLAGVATAGGAVWTGTRAVGNGVWKGAKAVGRFFRDNADVFLVVGLVALAAAGGAASSGSSYAPDGSYYGPYVAENGDIRGADNDGDGRPEPIFVRGYYRQDGVYVSSHYRARRY